MNHFPLFDYVQDSITSNIISLKSFLIKCTRACFGFHFHLHFQLQISLSISMNSTNFTGEAFGFLWTCSTICSMLTNSLLFQELHWIAPIQIQISDPKHDFSLAHTSKRLSFVCALKVLLPARIESNYAIKTVTSKITKGKKHETVIIIVQGHKQRIKLQQWWTYKLTKVAAWLFGPQDT